jgi:hypothetical protein
MANPSIRIPTTIKGPFRIQLRGHAGQQTVGDGAEIAETVQVPAGQTANVWQLEKPDGTIIAYIDCNGNGNFAGVSASSQVCDDSVLVIDNHAAPTKQIAFSAAGITAGQKRVLTAPDYNGTLATLAGAETLTNKTATQVHGKTVLHTACLTVTLAQIKAGVSIVAAVGGVALTVTGFRLKFTGNFATATSINLSDTTAPPVDIATVLIADCSDGNSLTASGGTGLTVGAGFGPAGLAAGKGIQLRDVAANSATGGTSVDVTVDYLVT